LEGGDGTIWLSGEFLHGGFATIVIWIVELRDERIDLGLEGCDGGRCLHVQVVGHGENAQVVGAIRQMIEREIGLVALLPRPFVKFPTKDDQTERFWVQMGREGIGRGGLQGDAAVAAGISAAWVRLKFLIYRSFCHGLLHRIENTSRGRASAK
jgi:hypothetical protein